MKRANSSDSSKTAISKRQKIGHDKTESKKIKGEVQNVVDSVALLEILSQESYAKHLEVSPLQDRDGAEYTPIDAPMKRNESSCSSFKSVTKDFFETTWQLHPVLYKKKENNVKEDQSNDYNHPLKDVISMGWNGIIQMLEQSQAYNQKEPPQSYHHFKPLFLQNQEPLQPTQMQTKYSSNPFAAYLDGCSIIQNHAEYFSMPLSTLCLDLQKSFPHCYCNTYLTPPNSSTVKAHADDRDVFVIQIKGKKKWKVYRRVPVAYPYTHEQVGKNNLSIPYEVTHNTTKEEEQKPILLIDTTLEEGDIMMIPRGYVHEASTSECDNQPSFHATIAIMTSDWSYSKTIAEMVRKCLDEIPQHRMAVHVDIGREKEDSIAEYIKDSVEMQLQSIFDRIKKCITVESIGKELNTKYSLHNQNSDSMRKRLYANEKENMEKRKIEKTVIVGPTAASYVSMESKVRASTLTERESVSIGDRGLAVREKISEVLLSLIAIMKKNMDTAFRLDDLRALIQDGRKNRETIICDFTLCSFVKCCVSLGVMSVVSY